MVARGSVKFSEMLYVQVLILDLRWNLLDNSRKYFLDMQASSSRNQDRILRIKLKVVPNLF